MTLKLIQAGGFTGKSKVSEENLENYGEGLKNQVENLFAQPSANAAPDNSPARDKEKLYLQYNEKLIPVNESHLNSDLKNLINKMKENLHYEK